MSHARRTPVALVTGASGGLGHDFATLLAARGYDLVVVARGTAQLEKLATTLRSRFERAVTIASIDLAQPDACDRVVRVVNDAGLLVDVLVNNAGFGDSGPVATADPGKLHAMTQLNVVTLTDLTRAFVAPMIERGHGRIMLVASTAAYQPGPLMATYCATKAYVRSFGIALAYELRGTGVTLTTYCPGATKTGFQAAARFGPDAPLNRLNAMTSADVAQRGIDALFAGKSVAIPGALNHLSAFAGHHLPPALTNPVAAKLLASD